MGIPVFVTAHWIRQTWKSRHVSPADVMRIGLVVVSWVLLMVHVATGQPAWGVGALGADVGVAARRRRRADPGVRR
ncbi:MAG TPA: hypothetical protein VE709_04745 [Pseudonocardiaceae bacterium]|nr:hypothetical protein [Pseudonocardiaceae bacterium]